MRRQSALILMLLAGAGCNRQDVDGLGRIGRKVIDRTQAVVSPLRDKFDQSVQGINTLGLRQRVQHRMQWDKFLAESHIEVAVTEQEVQLKGTLKREEQRRRAIELAESTLGVERVADHLQVE